MATSVCLAFLATLWVLGAAAFGLAAATLTLGAAALGAAAFGAAVFGAAALGLATAALGLAAASFLGAAADAGLAVFAGSLADIVFPSKTNALDGGTRERTSPACAAELGTKNLGHYCGPKFSNFCSTIISKVAVRAQEINSSGYDALNNRVLKLLLIYTLPFFIDI